MKKMLRSLLRKLAGNPAICHDVEAWIQHHSPGSYQMVHEPIPFTRKLPLALGNVIAPDFLDLVQGNTNKVFLGAIKDAHLCGEEGLVVLPDGRFAWDYLTWDEKRIRETRYFSKYFRFKSNVRKLKGTFFPLNGIWCASYYHWMHDVLQRLLLVAGRMPEDVKIIVPNTVDSKLLRALESFGLKPDRLVFQGREEILKLEKLLFAPPPMLVGHSAPHYAGRVREKLHGSLSWNRLSRLPRTRLYISRNKALSRRLVNEEEVIEGLKSIGFIKIVCEDLNWDQNAQLFLDAEIIVAPHGAGLANLFFCQPGISVVEIFPGSVGRRTCYWTLSDALGINYGYVLGNGPLNQHDDMNVSLQQIFECLALLGVCN
jgi:hypothetical protein